MDENMTEVLDVVGEKLFANITVSKMESACYHSYSNVDTSKYDDYTVGEFLQLYKINRMFELAAISKEERDNLETLFYVKCKLDRKIGEELLKELNSKDLHTGKKTYVSKIKPKLLQETERIEKEFDKYCLNVDEMKLKTVIDTIISGEDYENWIISDIEQLNEVANEVKKLKI